MSLTLRRNPKRNRTAPKRFEDEKFVSGAVDRYQHCYEANKEGKYDCINGNEDYYTTKDGRKFVTIEYRINWAVSGKIIHRWRPRDFPESVLEFTSIWRDMNMVLPSDIVSVISSFLKLSEIDQALIADDDEFIVGDEEEEPKKWSCSGLPMEDKSEEEWDSDEETDESEWDSDCLSDGDEDQEGKYWAGPPYFTDGYGTEED